MSKNRKGRLAKPVLGFVDMLQITPLSNWNGVSMRRTIAMFVLMAGIFLLGCNDKDTPKGGGSTASTSGAVAKAGNTHAGWWCTEHGIPEDDCLMCKSEGGLDGEALCKKKGDWCDIHHFCKSQCFGCDPKLRARYAAQYKEKYGKEPPEPHDNPPQGNPGKK